MANHLLQALDSPSPGQLWNRQVSSVVPVIHLSLLELAPPHRVHSLAQATVLRMRIEYPYSLSPEQVFVVVWPATKIVFYEKRG